MEFIALVDAAVKQVSQGAETLVLVEGGTMSDFFCGDRLADMDMHIALGLRDAAEDADDILVRGLGVDARQRSISGDSLHGVARFELIADSHRDDVHPDEILLEVARARHREHLDQSLVRAVVAILRATVALRNPYRAVLFVEDMVYIVGEENRVVLEVASGAVADNGKHLVETEEVDHEVVLHQVVAEANFRGSEAVVEQHDVE